MIADEFTRLDTDMSAATDPNYLTLEELNKVYPLAEAEKVMTDFDLEPTGSLDK